MKINTTPFTGRCFICILLFFPIFTFSQSTFPSDSIDFKSINTIFQELQSYDKMVITTNLDSLIENKRAGEWQPASVQLFGKGKKDIVSKIKVKSRGKFRRMRCDLPPLKIDFPKKNLDKLGLFPSYDKFKLVTHCLLDPEREQLVVKEYWTYQMFEKVSPHSFKTHLLEVIYVHENDAERTMEGHAFIIEPAEEMAHRLDGRLIKGTGTKTEQVTTASYHDALLFNFMIGNTDWKISLQKNLKLVQLKKDSLFTIVPYDFDLTKFVNPPYMVFYPDAEKLEINNRHAKGFFTNKKALLEQIEKFTSLKESGFRDYRDCSILTKKEKANMKLYLNPFYKMLKKKKKLVKAFLPDISHSAKIDSTERD